MSLTEKNFYWTRDVGKMDHKAHMNVRKEAIRKLDYSLRLPAELRRRLARILPHEFKDYDQNVVIEDSAVKTPVSFDRGDEAADESTSSEIERLEHEFQKFDLTLHTPLEAQAKRKKKHHWTSSYNVNSKQSIRWNSRIYDMETGLGDKTLDEQAEQLMDNSAERCSNWINSLGSNWDSDITKKKIMSIFSIESDRKLLTLIMTEPKKVKAIVKTVANRWNLPEMIIQVLYENCFKNRLKNVPKKPITVAFGRTIPVKERIWLPSEADVPITTLHPDELLSIKKFFNGITQLRSIHPLANFYKRKPKLDCPRYLVRSGLFKEKAAATEVAEIPLYEKLNLKH